MECGEKGAKGEKNIGLPINGFYFFKNREDME
jgi:hypothetical protein